MEFLISFLAFSLIIIALAIGSLFFKLRLREPCEGEEKFDENGLPLCDLCEEKVRQDCSLIEVKKRVAAIRRKRQREMAGSLH